MDMPEVKVILYTYTLVMCLQMREKELERNQEDTRPLSDGSAYEQQLSAAVRKRDKASPRPQVTSLILVFTVFFRII
jgi:hypothetical protein